MPRHNLNVYFNFSGRKYKFKNKSTYCFLNHDCSLFTFINNLTTIEYNKCLLLTSTRYLYLLHILYIEKLKKKIFIDCNLKILTTVI